MILTLLFVKSVTDSENISVQNISWFMSFLSKSIGQTRVHCTCLGVKFVWINSDMTKDENTLYYYILDRVPGFLLVKTTSHDM